MASEEDTMENCLVLLCIEAASQSRDAVETWRRQRRTLERMPSQLADALLHRLLRRRLLHPSLLEVFKYNVEDIDLRGQRSVDAEWMAYLGAFRYLRSLNVADCHRINSSALWALAGMTSLKELDISRCSKVTDAGIKHLLTIPTLEKLHISETGVTAVGITHLSSLTNLSVLNLGGLPVTDLALSSLLVLRKLQHLDLWGSEITNKGAAVLKMYPKLSFLNLGWTKVTKLPNLSSLTCLNMSNCTIDSLFEECSDKAPLVMLNLSGATFIDVSEAFLYVETGSLSFLDVSHSSLQGFHFLPCMNALDHLDLSSTLMEDDSVELITCMGAKLRNLNLSKTRVSSAGVEILAGRVPNLEIISLSCTSVDDYAISCISKMPSLKVINLSNTNVKGLIQQVGTETDWIPSLAALQNLKWLEKLDLEDTKISDAAVPPLSSFQELSHLSLKSGFLTDASLDHLSSIPKLTNLSIQDVVLTNAGIDSFNPPKTLKILDLRGCWLLTENVIMLFCKQHPQIEVRHELMHHILQSDQEGSSYSSPSRVTPTTSQLKKQGKMPTSSFTRHNNIFLDQRLKYSREELLSMQFSASSLAPSHDRGSVIP
ncbi:uncharacterized protein LOC132283021 [Cornus florida]|uniref:uncharacterized protein LOC132283021 n=1 Tax=Cornus florida TaxID=4283 RepID=UPI00289A34D2|nr:uncharacterized protein LOC132283021 [Cornus florida]